MSEVTSETFVETFSASKSMLAEAVPASAEQATRLGIFSHQPSACFRPLECARIAERSFMPLSSFRALAWISEGQNPYFPRLRQSEEPRLASHPRWSVVVPLPPPHHAPRLDALLALPGAQALRGAKAAGTDAPTSMTEAGRLRRSHASDRESAPSSSGHDRRGRDIRGSFGGWRNSRHEAK